MIFFEFFCRDESIKFGWTLAVLVAVLVRLAVILSPVLGFGDWAGIGGFGDLGIWLVCEKPGFSPAETRFLRLVC